MQEVVIMKEESKDIKEMTVKKMKEYVKDVMVLRQTLIIGGMPENEIDEIIRIEGTERMKRYASMGGRRVFYRSNRRRNKPGFGGNSRKRKAPIRNGVGANLKNQFKCNTGGENVNRNKNNKP